MKAIHRASVVSLGVGALALLAGACAGILGIDPDKFVFEGDASDALPDSSDAAASDSDSGSCPIDLSGTWSMSGCGMSTCNISQSGCMFTTNCDNGRILASGVLPSNSGFPVTGTVTGTNDGIPVSCTDTATSDTKFHMACALCSADGTKLH
jgi:hypothetical protein